MSPGQFIKLVDFIQEHQRFSKEEFLDRYPHPFFVVPGDKEILLPKTKTGGSAISPVAKIAMTPGSTMRMSFEEIDETLPPSFRKVVVEKAVVIPLAFREISEKQKQLTVGRTIDSDLFFEDDEISTKHATLISKGDPPIYFLIDHDSTNGTYLNGIALQPHKENRVKDQTSIEFGLNKLFIFYHPETLFKCINLA